MKHKNLTDFFLRRKPALMLTKLNGSNKKYASILAKEADCTYSHTVRVLQELGKRKLVNFEKKGRQKIITLTELGKEISDCFLKLDNLFNKVK